MEIDNQLERLYDRYQNNLATEQEVDELMELINDQANQGKIMQLFDKTWDELKIPPGSMPVGVVELPALERDKPAPVISIKRKRNAWIRVAAAAVIVALLGSGGYFLLQRPGKTPVATTLQHFKNDVAPGSSGAILQLANGSQIVLDSAKNGELLQQGNIEVTKKDSELVYSGKEDANSVEYHVMITPKGKQYSLVLADGSKVWLNAASSIRFPTAFVGNTRIVEITGEAYFEVAHDATKPFIVSVDDMKVEVLGTHFNINAYDNEPTINTTLLEGKVRVEKAGAIGLLKPGQQAQLNQAGGLNIFKDPDLEGVMAWKNGKFYFKSADLKSILRQAERWYDVQVEYQKNIDKRFNGEVSRSTNLSSLLKALELSGNVEFEIEGKKIIVK